ncbi:MAG: helix-turn-helix domain-containing protein [Novosphingobium meiothermophilum]
MTRLLLTEDEAAQSLDISPRTLREIRRRGMIRYIRPSPRKVRYTPEDIDEYLTRQTKQDEPTCRSTNRRKVRTGTTTSSSTVSAITEALALRRSGTRKR